MIISCLLLSLIFLFNKLVLSFQEIKLIKELSLHLSSLFPISQTQGMFLNISNRRTTNLLRKRKMKRMATNKKSSLKKLMSKKSKSLAFLSLKRRSSISSREWFQRLSLILSRVLLLLCRKQSTLTCSQSGPLVSRQMETISLLELTQNVLKSVRYPG